MITCAQGNPLAWRTETEEQNIWRLWHTPSHLWENKRLNSKLILKVYLGSEGFPILSINYQPPLPSMETQIQHGKAPNMSLGTSNVTPYYWQSFRRSLMAHLQFLLLQRLTQNTLSLSSSWWDQRQETAWDLKRASGFAGHWFVFNFNQAHIQEIYLLDSSTTVRIMGEEAF